MPARVNKIRHDENTRAKIKVGNIITYLQRHLAGECQLSMTQLKAAEILLRKALPDLTSVEHSGEVSTVSVIRAPEVIQNIDEWQKRYSPSLN